MLGPAVRRKPYTPPPTTSSLPTTAPPTQRPWPSMYLVAEWITMSAPRSSGRWRTGVQKQLSTTSQQSCRCASSASAAMSPSSVNGLEGVSRNSMRVFGVMADAQASRSSSGTNRVRMPSLPRYWLNRTTVLPKMLREATISSPASSNPRQVDRIAAMPDAVATQRSPPSIAASRVSKVRTVGLVKRE